MGRLKGRGLPNRLGKAKSRLGRSAPVDKAARSRQRDKEQPWRAWYKTARWQALRLRILERDEWTCQAIGVPLVEGRTAPNSAVVDHIRRHAGDAELFWDPTNLRAVCKTWHDQEKQRQERSGLA